MNQKMNQEQNVELIKEMILRAKGNAVEDNGNFLLLWGHIYFIAPLMHFFVIKLAISDYITNTQIGIYTSVIYGVAFLIGVIGHVILLKKEKRVKRTTTYAELILNSTWYGFMGGIFIVNIVFSDYQMLIYPAIVLLYTFALYMTASIMKFKKLYISVAICVCCAILYKFIPNEYYPIPMAIVMLVGNVIPGYVLKFGSKN